MHHTFSRFLYLFLLVSSGLPLLLCAQAPAPGSVVYGTRVYFEGDFNSDDHYQLLVYADSAKHTLLFEQKASLPAFEQDGFAFGKTYFWTIKSPADPLSGRLHSFRVQNRSFPSNLVDTRLTVRLNDSLSHGNELMLLDYARGVFSRSGEQVWTLPELNGLVHPRRQLRDLKVTPDKTLSFLSGGQAVEIDFEGNILWQAPYPFYFKGDTVVYHHDFKKMPNGHYFVAAQRSVCRRLLGSFPAELLEHEYNMVLRGDSACKKCSMSAVLEFDQEGKLVWWWDSNDYFTDEDLNHKKAPNGIPSFATHMNAFSVNENYTKVYAGFRDMSRIVRIDKRSKKVEHSIGEKYPSGHAVTGAGVFRGQHDATITKRGSILVFNNNTDRNAGIASLLELKDQKKITEPLVLWQFGLDFDSLSDGKSTAAGNLEEQRNGDLLVCGGMMPRLFQVKKNRRLVWDAVPYSRSETDSSWLPFPQYRIHSAEKIWRRSFLIKVREQKATEISLTLYNTGNVDDRYIFTFLSSENKEISRSSGTQVRAGHHSAAKLKIPQGSEKLIVTSHKNRFVLKTVGLK